GAFANWPLPRLIDALQKVCHDTLSVAVGAAPRYFPPGSVRAGAAPQALHGWMRELNRVARHADHPWNAGLLVEALVQQGQRALQASGPAGRAPQRSSVHSGR
ncbi:MAG TPA: DNA polymerase III subunit delta', partial [Burkholderiaceae bacterium]